MKPGKKAMQFCFSLILPVILFTACEIFPPGPVSADGIWKSRGYGNIAEVENDFADVYDVTIHPDGTVEIKKRD